MEKKIEIQKVILEKPVYVEMIVTEAGIQVLVAGGDKGHIGAVSIVNPQGELVSHCFLGHKEDKITEKWANAIYAKAGVAVVVSAGVHYNHISKEQIISVLDTTDALLSEVLEKI